ncbi:MAG: hypothetical protein GQ582_02050 [Methyloprofundus sp.]|nr:hypothetical protein [Methyloprofundus sp.]
MSSLKTPLLLLISCHLTLLVGCSSIIDARKQKQGDIAHYYAGNMQLAAKALSSEAESHHESGDELMWRLEQGTALFDATDYPQSLAAFQRCENIIQDFDQRAVISARTGGAEIGAALTNANALPYTGMPLDKLMLNAYKALNYFALNDVAAAQVELRRMREAQKQVQRKFREEIEQSQQEIDAHNKQNREQAKNSAINFEQISKNNTIKQVYQSSAKKSNPLYGALSNPFVSYFSAMGYLMAGNYSEALVDFRNLYKMLPNNKLIQQDYVSCAQQIGAKIPAELQHIPAYAEPLNQKRVYVLFFNGRAPALKQEKFQIILPYVGYTGIAYPRYEYFKSTLQGLNIDYQQQGLQDSIQTEQVADFDAIMSQEYHQKLPTMITRLVISTLTKELASLAATQAARNAGGTEAQLAALIVTGIYKALFNTADTRGWETLPQEIQIAHIPLPDNGVLNISPEGINKSMEIKLKSDTNNAIVLVRALANNTLIYKLFEMP